MTLAAIVLNASLVLSPALAAGALLCANTAVASTLPAIQDQASPQSQPAAASSQTSPPQSSPAQATQSQSQTQSKSKSQSQSKSQTKTNAAAQKRPATAKAAHKSTPKAKVAPPNCNPAPANGTAAATKTPPGSTQSNSSSGAGAASGSANNSANAPAASNCPPPKIVVQQGSAPEPSIQLAGDPASSSTLRTTECLDAGRCLQSADDNLKKIAGRDLNSDQKDMVTQVQQFIEQSKTAAKNGDLDSARTLAWKAQSLSEELASPGK